MGLGSRLSHAWNAFLGRDPTHYHHEYGSFHRPDRFQAQYNNARSITIPIYERIAIEVASLRFEHARLDERGRYIESIDSGLNECLNLAANRDQTGRDFIKDVVMTILDEGCCAIVPTMGNGNPYEGSFDPTCLRVGKIIEWFPKAIKVEVYNQDTGNREELVVSKKFTPIIENPQYATMNQTNSTLRRLVRKLNLLDQIDEMSASGKLDLIVQLPFAVKTEGRKRIAEARMKDLETQLATGKYGIAYIDSTEKTIQLNRSLENKLFEQIEYYTKMLYGQLGMSEGVFNGTAKEDEQLAFYNRATEPIASAICNGLRWKFLTKTARTQGQTVMFFKDVFKLVPVNQIADIADKLTRNEILSSNEVRGILGFKPSNQEGADDLRNKNINQSNEQANNPDKAESAGELISQQRR